MLIRLVSKGKKILVALVLDYLKNRFWGYKSGKTQSGKNVFGNFIPKPNSAYFSIYYILFLEQITQSYHRKKTFWGIFGSFSIKTMCSASSIGVVLVQSYKHSKVSDTEIQVRCCYDFFQKKNSS